MGLISRRFIKINQSNLAEGKGFEPPEPCGSSDFESDAIDHSATPPNQDC